ncbi:GNAT family N-acetyltransferase [Aquibacillus sp. 3ASR75-11]|uniref:GNAT family N-acetyltransferase n=1 Tax=Terrihalobacillus insolitus TaxID=2950438 RepID=A0A9X3WY86_9BACI|nr:GNAT family N-acetyltransferase [Terrihalobacillus insolitus]MDC3415265.1 GNAT family N-acetyltransferase [Terrihalobacillus insolitus]MDC3426366.1 GNAT family N-acetyltransferase [Terrihalobacillus insolitus]
MHYNIEILLENSEKFSTFLHTKIKEFNNEHSLHHREVRKNDAVQPINIIVSDNKEQWIGGISAEVYWDWVEINDFWFSEEHRGKGLGGVLLDNTEKVAKEKGAKKALLTTFEFQARSFYEMKGYQVVGEIKDYPPGSSYYTMVKSLT